MRETREIGMTESGDLESVGRTLRKEYVISAQQDGRLQRYKKMPEEGDLMRHSE